MDNGQKRIEHHTQFKLYISATTESLQINNDNYSADEFSSNANSAIYKKKHNRDNFDAVDEIPETNKMDANRDDNTKLDNDTTFTATSSPTTTNQHTKRLPTYLKDYELQ